MQTQKFIFKVLSWRIPKEEHSKKKSHFVTDQGGRSFLKVNFLSTTKFLNKKTEFKSYKKSFFFEFKPLKKSKFKPLKKKKKKI